MRTSCWKLGVVLAGFFLIGGYAAAQATVACTPIAGVMIENFNQEFIIGEGPIALGVISGDLNGGTFFAWGPPGGDVPAEGIITLASGDTLRVQVRITTEAVAGGFEHLSEQVTIRSGTGAYRRASGSFESHGSMRGDVFAELVTRYQGEVCVPAR